VVTAQWALGLSAARLKIIGSQHICDLLNDDVIRPDDMATRFSLFQLMLLQDHASIRALLRERVVTTEQFSAMDNLKLLPLVDPEFQQKLRDPEIQTRLHSGELTLNELIRQRLAEGATSSSASTAPSSPTQPGKVFPFDWFLPASMGPNGKIVTRGWPQTEAQHFTLLSTIKPIWNLVSAGLLSRAQARKLDLSEIATLQKCPAICQLVSDNIIDSAQLVSLRFDQLQKLTQPEAQQKVRDGEWTITHGRLTPTERFTARGALNYASSGYLGKSGQVLKAGAGAIKTRDDGSTAYCINLHVLHAIREILRRGEDLDTIAIIFDNALRYGYLNELAAIIDSRNKDLLCQVTNHEKVDALINRLEERGLQLKVKSGGAFELCELAMGPTDPTAQQASFEALDAFLPPSLSKLIIVPFNDAPSFETALSRRFANGLSYVKQYPLPLAYLRQAFNEGVIDSRYINEQLTVVIVKILHQLLLAQHDLPALKDIVKNHKGILFQFGPTMLTCLISQPNPCVLIQRGELTWEDLLELDSIIKTRKIKNDLQAIFGKAYDTREWIVTNGLRTWQKKPLLSGARGGFGFLYPDMEGIWEDLLFEDSLKTGSAKRDESLYAIFSAKEQTEFELNDEQLVQLNAKSQVQRRVLRTLLAAQLCTPAFAVKRDLRFCIALSRPHVMNLVKSQLISLDDVANKFSEDHFKCLELDPSVCQLLADGIISGNAYTGLDRVQLAKLRMAEIQQKLRIRAMLNNETWSLGAVLDQS
jgi:hypothetical protein